MLRNLLIIILIISYVENSLIHKCSLTSQRFCDSGECIDSLNFCDGTVDCQDQSDETEENCKAYTCPINLFKCNYGGCIEFSNICDGKNDCIDGSDEEECSLSDHLNGTIVNKRQAVCENELHAKCENGKCIPRIQFCDGIEHCEDGSDETSKTCLDKIPCRSGFKCKYGACISKKKVCDGNFDCADESDESSIYANCKSQSQYPQTPINRSKTKCTIPNIENLSIYQTKIDSTYTNRLYPGNVVETSMNKLHYICAEGFKLREDNDLPLNYTNYCIDDGTWAKRHATCTKLCASKDIIGVSFWASCDGRRNDCASKPYHLPGTKAKLECQFNYEQPDFYRTNLLCEESGNWDHIPQRCEPKCGIVNDMVVGGLVSGGAASTEIYEVPWHAAIFIKKDEIQDGWYENICGGTIINARLILTAAHCFWNRAQEYNGNNLDRTKYKIVVGTTARSFANRSTESQTFSAEEIILHYNYQGPGHVYLYDIAIVVLNSSIIFDSYKSPICIDKNPLNKQLESGIQGKIAGWGQIGVNQRPDVLQSVDILSLNFKECKKKIPQLAPDKFCLDTINKTGYVCYGDSGGAFVEIKKVNNEDRHVIRGVLSSGYYTVTCGEHLVSGFTDISAHDYIRFIEEKEQKYNPL